MVMVVVTVVGRERDDGWQNNTPAGESTPQAWGPFPHTKGTPGRQPADLEQGVEPGSPGRPSVTPGSQQWGGGRRAESE